MKNISTIEFHTGSKEERLPGFAPDFPCIASCVDLDHYPGRFCPWHWHKSVELFYMKSGSLEYSTPGGKMIFPAGSGGMVNSNVLHMTKALGDREKNIQLLHIFDPVLIAGEQGSRIAQKYVLPIVTAKQPEIIALHPQNPRHAGILALIRDSFSLSEQDFGYELKLREALSKIWLSLFSIAETAPQESKNAAHADDKIKTMMIFIHEHFGEKITVSQLSEAAFCSERECFRSFQECLHMSPAAYMKSYRLQMACQKLSQSSESITEISHACGLGSSSYFGKVFREQFGCTPLEYRRKWQDRDI